MYDNAVSGSPPSLQDNLTGANTGLVSNEVILWQETRIAQGEEIELDVAGHQMLRPSTNNYIIYEWVSTNSSSGYLREVGGYFSAIIAPQTITLGTEKYSNNDGKHIPYHLILD